MLENLDLSIEKHQNNIEIVHLTASQIMKDFAMFGMQISFSGNTSLAYQELMNQVSNHLRQMLSDDPPRLFSLLYQIDINQTSVNKCISHHQQPAIALADLIIRREMLKVLTVKYFKDQKANK